MGRITLLACLLATPLLLAVAVAGAGPEVLAGEQSGTLWVTNRALHNVALYDGATGNVIDVIPVGREPNDVTVAPGTGKAYVTDEADNTVSVISLGSRSVIKKIPVSARPHHVETSRDGSKVYFGEFGTNKVGIIDTRTDTLTEFAASPNAAARTHQAWPTADGRMIFATNEVTNDVAAIDAATGRIVFALAVGTRPSEVVVTPDERTAYVSIRGEDKVRVFDLLRQTAIGEVTVGTQPDTLQLAPDGRMLIVALRGTPAQVVYVDTASLRVVRTVNAAPAGTLAAHQWITADARYTFTAYEGGSSPGVSVLDNVTGEIVRTDPYPGGGRPHGMYYADPDAKRRCHRLRPRQGQAMR